MSASIKLRSILGNRPTGDSGSAYIEKLSESPLIGVGFVASEGLELVLVIPPGTLPQSVKTSRLIGKRNGLLNIHAKSELAETIQADYLLFDQLSPAVAIVLDAFTEALMLGDKSLAVDLLSDFMDLFKPSNGVSDDEVIGLWGELVVISTWENLDSAITCWHEDPTGRYDFASGQKRIEVKTTQSSVRTHTFSSTQLPAADGIELVIASLLADVVHGATSLLDLWAELDSKLTNPTTRKKLKNQVFSLVRRDPEKVGEMTFDRDLSQLSIMYFRSEDVPSIQLPHAVLRAKWDSLINEELAISAINILPSGPEEELFIIAGD